ncbi:CPBP family intramembrane metalloprotease [Glycomyces sp. A-F 0318]|uniref:CPBP family intramembrane glutamic endopeptidase n=1 Tax=Glycomyces amatae TaxID=2881355 RepID=UPI001E384593|nr:CPBP family intramembrane glutamic endopeptidase [Glycomyces amatae]MCD0442885.1 CPBP family intramembrane metalloprotease [Glycomyces amatae]
MPSSSSRTAPSPWPVLGVFTLLAFLFSGAIGLLQPAVDAELLTLAQFGPALGALATWLIYRRRLKALLPQAVSRKQVVAHTVLMAAAVALFAALAIGFSLATGTGLAGVSSVAGAPFVLYLVLQLVGATGEEIGWRGLMQPLFETRMGRFAASVVTGVVWALWHVQIFTAGLLVAASFLVSTIAFAVLLGHMGNGAFWQRVATAAAGHWLINVALHTVAGEEVNESPQVYVTAVAAVVTTAVFMALFRRAVARRRGREAAAL